MFVQGAVSDVMIFRAASHHDLKVARFTLLVAILIALHLVLYNLWNLPKMDLLTEFIL